MTFRSAALLIPACAGAALLAACAQTATAAPPAPVAAMDDGDNSWRLAGDAALEARLARTVNHARAKNVVIFIADGASPTLFTAMRIHEGQRMGEIGDLHDAPTDLFPYTALSRTHSSNDRITDSAASATAMFNGVKSHNGAIGVGGDVTTCAEALAAPVSSLIDVARASGRKVGVMTTSTITDATPAALYAHAPNRSWQDPRNLTADDRAMGCRDIPEQLIAKDLDVAIGGGRVVFTPESEGGVRADGRDLGAEWAARGGGRVYADSPEAFAAVDPARTERLLALLSPEEMFDPPRFDGGPTTTPTLAAMTETALDVLGDPDQGFFLMVEHEGTDEHQHAGHIGLALDSGVELYDAVRVVLAREDLADTLVIVTADHGQPLAMGGGAPLDAPLLGRAFYGGRVANGRDGAPFSQLGFYVGPHGRAPDPNLTDADIAKRDYVPDAAVPLGAVTHSGVDVPVYATGAWADLFTGVIEDNAVFNFVRHAMSTDE